MSTQINLILIGAGKVGQELIRQVHNSNLPIKFSLISDHQAFIEGDPITEEQIEKIITLKSEKKSLKQLAMSMPISDLQDYFQPGRIVVDCSASKELNLLPALDIGCKLVFANKNALSAPWNDAAGYYNNSSVRYEATVGAGLPVIQTLKTMLATGDQIIRIEGVMSGTMGFLCSQLEAGFSYSQAIKEAFSTGFTEPDPRDDLSGFDVARKALILARTAGWPLEQKDLIIEALYDPSQVGISVDRFFREMSEMDSTYDSRVQEAASVGKVLRYVATITPQSAKIGLQAVEKKSALGALSGPANFFAFHSQRYQPIPLVISGPGAGVVVTAAGVIGDILEIINQR
jgi:homoserine dehydrogenase